MGLGELAWGSSIGVFFPQVGVLRRLSNRSRVFERAWGVSLSLWIGIGMHVVVVFPCRVPYLLPWGVAEDNKTTPLLLLHLSRVVPIGVRAGRNELNSGVGVTHAAAQAATKKPPLAADEPRSDTFTLIRIFSLRVRACRPFDMSAATTVSSTKTGVSWASVTTAFRWDAAMTICLGRARQEMSSTPSTR